MGQFKFEKCLDIDGLYTIDLKYLQMKEVII